MNPTRKPRLLKPILDRPEYAAAIERHLIEYLDAVVFGPLDDLLEEVGLGKVQARADRRENAARIALNPAYASTLTRTPHFDASIIRGSGIAGLIDALQTGRVWYADGKFCGQFNAAISRELRALGATPNAEAGTFAISQENIPTDLRATLANATEKAQALQKTIGDFLGKAAENVAKAPAGLTMRQTLDKIMVSLQNQFVISIEEVGEKDIGIGLKPTEEIDETLRTTLVNNLDLEIKGWAAQEIAALRERVQANALAGYRADKLAREIAAERGISLRKADFIAEQETSLFVSKWREQRAKDVGCTRYKWSTSHDERVRPDHRVLNGKIFSFDAPPITDQATGAHNNPGEDFRCRCVAIPIMD